MRYSGVMLIVIIAVCFIVQDRLIYALQNDIKESRQREQLLYQECTQLNKLTSLLTIAFKESLELQIKLKNH